MTRDLREKCEKWLDKTTTVNVDNLEAFALSIRDEALEEAAKVVQDADLDGSHELCCDDIRALKEST